MAQPIISSTLQSCLLTALSNLIAQYIKLYRNDRANITSSYKIINWTTVFNFVLFTAINSPPNFLWQIYLENTFPSHYLNTSVLINEKTPDTSHTNETKNATKEEDSSVIRKNHVDSSLSVPRLSVRNTLIKFILDQTIGACINTLLFSMVMAGFNGATFEEATAVAGKEFWPVMMAGWRLWPAISLLNFGVVKTVEGRTLLGSLAGMAWGVYLSLMKN